MAPAVRSDRARSKAASKRDEHGRPVHSFQSLLRDLATLTKNRVQRRTTGVPSFEMIATPTPLQQRAYDLLGVSCRM